MINKRCSRRIEILVNGQLHYKELHLPCRIKNISNTGVLISLNDSLSDPICRGELWNLTLYCGGEGSPLTLATQVVHYGFSLIGLKFVNPDIVEGKILEEIIGRKIGGTTSDVPDFILDKGLASC